MLKIIFNLKLAINHHTKKPYPQTSTFYSINFVKHTINKTKFMPGYFTMISKIIEYFESVHSNYNQKHKS